MGREWVGRGAGSGGFAGWWTYRWACRWRGVDWPFAFVAAGVVLAAGCAPRTFASGVAMPPDSVELDGVIYRAEAAFAGVDTLRVVSAVLVRNPTERPVEVRLAACPLLVRIHWMADRGGGAAWDEARWLGVDDGSERCALSRPHVLPPGKVRRFKQTTSIPIGLASLLPPVRYRFAVSVPLPSRRIELSAGTAELRRPADRGRVSRPADAGHRRCDQEEAYRPGRREAGSTRGELRR